MQTFIDMTPATDHACRKYMDKLLERSGPFTDPDVFEPGDAPKATLDRYKIL